MPDKILELLYRRHFGSVAGIRVLLSKAGCIDAAYEQRVAFRSIGTGQVSRCAEKQVQVRLRRCGNCFVESCRLWILEGTVSQRGVQCCRREKRRRMLRGIADDQATRRGEERERSRRRDTGGNEEDKGRIRGGARGVSVVDSRIALSWLSGAGYDDVVG